MGIYGNEKGMGWIRDSSFISYLDVGFYFEWDDKEIGLIDVFKKYFGCWDKNI